jgi:hypothetical protein
MRVEPAVELVGGTVEDPGQLPPVRTGELGAGARDLLDGVEQRAVVDAHGVGEFVFDQRAVHEGAEVAQRALMQLRAGNARRDRHRQRGRDLVHVGQAVGERYRDLRSGGALGHARADRLGQRQLAAQVVGLLGRDAQVGADGGDAVHFGEPGAGLPAVSELRLLIDGGKLLGAVGLGLDAQDLLTAGLVVEQQHDQAADGREALEAGAAGELFAGLGGEQPALAVIDADELLGRRAPAETGRQLAEAHQHPGEPVDAVG